jgi:putative flippase GtrA
VVGFSGVFVDFGITYLFREKVKIQQFIANAIGFCTAATTNYIFNRIWTFQSQNPEVIAEFGEFFFFSLIGLGINTLILWFLVSKIKWNFYVSKLFAIGIVTIWNFVVNSIYTFS